MGEEDLLILDLDLLTLALLDESTVDEMQEFGEFLVVVELGEVVILVHVE